LQQQSQVQREGNQMKRISDRESNEIKREGNQFNRISQKESNVNTQDSKGSE
jgi:hypothetical protein